MTLSLPSTLAAIATFGLWLAVAPAFAQPTSTPRMLLDFDSPDGRGRWMTVNDNVMGGVSTGGSQFRPGILEFRGETRLENNGGFSSIRTHRRNWPLADGEAIEIRVRGNPEREYIFSLETDARRAGWRISYWQRFRLEGEGWQKIRLALDQFRPTSFGFELEGPALERSKIRSMGFMVYDKKAGPFHLECDWIKVHSRDSVDEDVAGDSSAEAAKSLGQRLVEDGRLNALKTAIEAAGLGDLLEADGPFTLLAPNDSAFAKLGSNPFEAFSGPEGRARLRRILSHHTIEGRLDARALIFRGGVTSLAGTGIEVRLVDGRVVVGKARVLRNGIAARNGIVHVIDRVLEPGTGEDPESKPGPAAGLIEEAVTKGSRLFNAGNVEGCVALYQVTITALVTFENRELAPAAQADLVAALARSEGRRDRDTAWELRRALDSAWRGLGER